jgi:hypothetical protein
MSFFLYLHPFIFIYVAKNKYEQNVNKVKTKLTEYIYGAITNQGVFVQVQNNGTVILIGTLNAAIKVMMRAGVLYFCTSTDSPYA